MEGPYSKIKSTGKSEQAEIADLDPLSDGKKRRISCQV